MENPLLQPFDAAPFSSIRTEHFKPAFDAALAEARAEIDAIADHPAPPDFENTIAALDYAGSRLDRISSIFFNLNAAETNAEIQALAQEVSPLLSEFSNDITLNESLFDRVRQVYEARETMDLDAESRTLVEKKFLHFRRNGALLDAAGKKRLREIDSELSRLKLTFGEHILEETNSYELHITREEDLEGLPESQREAARIRAGSGGKEGWIITLDYPSYLPFMKYAANRNLRKELYLAFGSKGFHGDARDNREIVLRIANLRFERARLLGYASHADFVLEQRMAKSPETVREFLEELLEKALPAAKRELGELAAYAEKRDGLTQLEPWDKAYYSEKLKQEKFALDDEILKPYFQLENVIDGVFEIAGRLYGLSFQPEDSLPTYHEEVRTYRVVDADGKLVALFYADFHPRPGKRGGAWMTSYKPQYRKGGTVERPHIAIVCNFTRPTSSQPALLTFDEVTTLFHEFGHALHGMLADTTYPGLSGTSVYWDFVELPSQLMENWCYEPDALALFARHYKTGEILPDTLIEKIKASANFQEGIATVRQLSFGFLDMAWHGGNPSDITDVKAHESEAFAPTRLFPEHPETCMSTAFAHIFQGGYASGYYSYKWAEVLDADAFASFRESGIFDRETARRFRDHILSRGGTEDPMELYVRFRGREPEIDALLKRAGLVPAAN
ncbi:MULTISPECIES: M3 family metallopeptidase [Robiginitalea]|uniref:M3 family metallopeptidase n=1 Tax=Robiginitalea TaxID=252306 RepID=UPI00234BFDB9|nr:MULTISPECIES: M3 family metallopeptidase [unclassified Robiginitalea]MDC6355532.1 M3 family metallopeptidase [Robiginitalea sp. PM2]MDC6375858.1 M3 family metallopeptidase [Robiginitalea sp. SP8]